MSVSTARGQIHAALKDLRLYWQRTRERWDDAVAHQFEERLWNPLEATTVNVLGTLDRLEQVLMQIRQECGDRETTEHEEALE
jgi:hypothetical protein